MKLRFILSVLILLLPICASGNSLVVTYPKGQSSLDIRRSEVVDLIKTALLKTEKTHGSFILKPSSYVANQLRQVSEIKQNKEDRINLAWMDHHEGIEKELYPIYIPIQKGIVGYRVFLIRSDSSDNFSKDMTFADLQKLTNGIGPGWMNEEIFKLNKLNYTKGSDYEGLFAMLSAGRFDYFSRGINEAFVELEDRKNLYPNMKVEESVALHYRHPIYLYTSRQNIELHDRLEKGLNIMVEDGSFNRIFCKYNKASIEQANLKDRKLFKLKDNLHIPEAVSDRKELWFDPMVDMCSTLEKSL